MSDPLADIVARAQAMLPGASRLPAIRAVNAAYAFTTRNANEAEDGLQDAGIAFDAKQEDVRLHFGYSGYCFLCGYLTALREEHDR